MTLSSPQVSAGPLDFVDIFVRGARSKIYKAFKMTTEALSPRKTGPHLKYSVVRILRITVIIQPMDPTILHPTQSLVQEPIQA